MAAGEGPAPRRRPGRPSTRPPKFDELLRRWWSGPASTMPRLRQRVQPAPVNLTAPMWVDDPNFDLRYHVRHLALPKPGSMRQLLDLASLLACDTFDRTRPLWQFVVVDGLRGADRARSSRRCITRSSTAKSRGAAQPAVPRLRRDAPEQPPLDPGACVAATEEAAAAERDPNPDVCATSSRAACACRSASCARWKGAARQPRGIPGAGSATADTLRGVMQQLGDTEAARARRCGRSGRCGGGWRCCEHRSATPAPPGEAAGRHAQHRLPRRRRGGCRPLPPPAGFAGGRATAPAWR